MGGVLEPSLVIALAATFAAGIIRGFSGFGAAMVQAPVFALLYSAPEAVATITALGTLASLQLLPGALREVRWRLVVTLTLAAWVAVPLGGLVLVSLDPDVMRRAISALILLMVAALMSGLRYPWEPGLKGTVVTGFFSGAINGATGVGGPPLVLYLLAGPDKSGTNRANLITYYTFLNAATFANVALHGVVTVEILWRTLALWPVQVVSLWLGSWLFRRANDAIYRRIALWVLLGVALFGLFYFR